MTSTDMESLEYGEWDHEALQAGIKTLAQTLALLHNIMGQSANVKVKQLLHTIDFIEYNLREM